jgi:hypothetical protein
MVAVTGLGKYPPVVALTITFSLLAGVVVYSLIKIRKETVVATSQSPTADS